MEGKKIQHYEQGSGRRTVGYIYRLPYKTITVNV